MRQQATEKSKKQIDTDITRHGTCLANSFMGIKITREKFPEHLIERGQGI